MIYDNIMIILMNTIFYLGHKLGTFVWLMNFEEFCELCVIYISAINASYILCEELSVVTISFEVKCVYGF